MSKSIATIEYDLKQILSTLTARQVLYANERVKQPIQPYLVMQYIAHTSVARRYLQYFDPDPDPDIELVSVRPCEITFSMLFIGGNARGELSTFLDAFWYEDVNNILMDKGLSYIRNGDIIDLSQAIGGDMEQRAQSDVVFSANIVVDKGIVGTVETAPIAGEIN